MSLRSFKFGSAASRRLIHPWIGGPVKHASKDGALLAGALIRTLHKLMIWQDAAGRQVPHPHVGFYARSTKGVELSAGSNEEST